MKATVKNIKKVTEVLLGNLEDENGRGEFDEKSDLREAFNRVIDWIEED